MNSSLKQVPPPEAWDILQTDETAVLLDVRTTMEYEYVGHPTEAINLPWMESPEWTVNKDFVREVQSVLTQKNPGKHIQGLPVLLICRSGKRSEAAGNVLIENGFDNVYNILEGFEGDRDGEKHRNSINGWRFHNLPWEQS